MTRRHPVRGRHEAVAADRLRHALALPENIRIDASFAELVLEIGEPYAGAVSVDGRPLPAGRRVLLGGERLRYGRRRVSLAPFEAHEGACATPEPSGEDGLAGNSRDLGTRAMGLAALASSAPAIVPSGPCLVILEGRSAGRRWPLLDGSQVIGRGLSAEIVLPNASVSRRHAEVCVSNGKVAIRDLGSRHGVLARGRRARPSLHLRHGDEIVIGEARLKLLMHPLTAAPAKTEPASAYAESGVSEEGWSRETWAATAAAALCLLGGVMSALALSAV